MRMAPLWNITVTALCLMPEGLWVCRVLILCYRSQVRCHPALPRASRPLWPVYA